MAAAAPQPLLRTHAISPRNALVVLSARFGTFTIQYFNQCKMIKTLLMQPPQEVDRQLYNRTILRGNRNALYIQQRKYFTSIGFLGAGGFGSVELVKSNETNRYYALKTVLAKPKHPMARFHMLSMIERDSATVLDSEHIVRLKAAWIEVNNESLEPDCFKLLWENMPYGDMGELIRQFHPAVIDKRGSSEEILGSRFYAFEGKTLAEVTDGIEIEEKYDCGYLELLLFLYEARAVKECGLRQRFS